MVQNWLKNYLSNRQIQVTLEGSTPKRRYISAGVPQGSILGRLLFLIYVHDITDEMHSLPYLYADDNALMMPIKKHNPAQSFRLLNEDPERLHQWAEQWHMLFNTQKTVHMVVSNDMCWDTHYDNIAMKTNRIIGRLWSLDRHVPRKHFERIKTSLARPIIE